MTREEAVKICTREKDCVQGALDACADGGHCVSPDGIITAFDYVEAMDMAIAALREQPQWISVEERLPEPDTDVLARRSIGTMDVEVYHEDEVAWTWDGLSKGFVTHWMPLPEPPEEEV